MKHPTYYHNELVGLRRDLRGSDAFKKRNAYIELRDRYKASEALILMLRSEYVLNYILAMDTIEAAHLKKLSNGK